MTEMFCPRCGPRRWQKILEGQAKKSLEKCLPRFLAARRWFGGKAKSIRSTTISDVIPLDLSDKEAEIQLILLRVDYIADEPETYLLPLAFVSGDRAGQMIAERSPALVAHIQVAIEDRIEEGMLFDAFGEESFGHILLDAIGSRCRFSGTEGKLYGHRGMAVQFAFQAGNPSARGDRIQQYVAKVFFSKGVEQHTFLNSVFDRHLYVSHQCGRPFGDHLLGAIPDTKASGRR